MACDVATGDAHDCCPERCHARRRRHCPHQRRLAYARAGTLNVLLGPTLSGKTSLMRLMAGLDVADHGPRRGERQGRDGHRRPQALASRWSTSSSSTTRRSRSSRTSPRRCASPAPTQREIERRVARGRRAAEAGRPISTARRSACRAASSSAPRIARALVKKRRSGAARRAAGQSRLQAARGTARRAAAHLRRVRRHLRLCHHRAARGAAARRPHRDCCPRAASRSSADTSRSTAGRDDLVTAPDLLRSAAQHHRAREEGRRASLVDGGGERPGASGLSPGLPTASYTIGFRAHQLVARPRPDAGHHACPATVTRDRNHRLGKLRASQFARRTTGSLLAPGVHDFQPGAGDRGVHRPATTSSSSTPTAGSSPRRAHGGLRSERWPASTSSDLAHSYAAEAEVRQRLRAEGDPR